MMTDTFIAVDVETTGLNPKTDRIIEIGAVKVVEGTVIETFDTLVNPECKLDTFITNLTGITDLMLERAPDEGEAFQMFLAFAQEEILLGHHLIFDYSFLKCMAVRQKVGFERKGIDTLKIARAFLPHVEKHSLEFLCSYYQIVNARAHRAWADAMATIELYRRLAEQFCKGDLQTERLFQAETLAYQVKKESPITAAQIRYLTALVQYHHICLEEDMKFMSKQAASRKIDQILSAYGRICDTARQK